VASGRHGERTQAWILECTTNDMTNQVSGTKKKKRITNHKNDGHCLAQAHTHTQTRTHEHTPRTHTGASLTASRRLHAWDCGTCRDCKAPAVLEDICVGHEGKGLVGRGVGGSGRGERRGRVRRDMRPGSCFGGWGLEAMRGSESEDTTRTGVESEIDVNCTCIWVRAPKEKDFEGVGTRGKGDAVGLERLLSAVILNKDHCGCTAMHQIH
jgi:hypothetical protein